MIRPRGGDFVYSEDELAMMEADVFSACEAETDGIVFGCLRELTEHAAGRLIILPGAGITYENVDEVVSGIGAPEAHGTKIVNIR